MAARQRGVLILASGSPRRREILRQLGIEHEVVTSGVEEPPHAGEAPAQYARHLAGLKAAEVSSRLSPARAGAWVLGADTIVVVDDEVLGKPLDDADAVRMLMCMSGRAHRVLTAVSVHQAGRDDSRVSDVETSVRFRAFDRETAERYVATGEGRDKAGSYAVQGLGGGLVAAVDGSPSNVIGLPAVETVLLLTEIGLLERWP